MILIEIVSHNEKGRIWLEKSAKSCYKQWINYLKKAIDLSKISFLNQLVFNLKKSHFDSLENNVHFRIV